MAIISRLAVLLGLDAGEFNAGLGKAKDKVQGFTASTTLSLAAITTAFVSVTKASLAYADQISDVAQANEMSVQSVLRLSQALQVSGGQSENSAKLMGTFNQKIDEAAQGSDKAQNLLLLATFDRRFCKATRDAGIAPEVRVLEIGGPTRT